MLKSGAYGAGVACGRVLVAYGSSYLHGKRYPAEERRGVAGEALRDGAEAVGNTLSLGLGIRKIDDGAEWQVDIVHPRQLGQAVSIGNGRRLFHENQHADRKSTRLNSSHVAISYADFCLTKKRSRG